MTIIKAGYRLNVESSERSGDNKRTIQKDGLDLAYVKFVVEIISHYRFNLGNIYEPTDKQLKEEKIVLRKVVDKYPNAQKILGLLDEEDMKIDDAIVECIHSSVLSTFMGRSDFYSRKCEKYTKLVS